MALALTWSIIFLGIGLAVGGIRGALRWTGAWRWVALVPLLAVVAVVLNIVIDVYQDATSHNLWPFEVLIAIVGASIFLGVSELVRIGLTKVAPRT